VSTRRTAPLALLVVLVVALGGAGLIAGAAQDDDLEQITIALDWYPNANHAGLFLAQERGYFAAEGLDVELVTPADPSTVLQTVGAGRDDFGISYQTDLLLARAQDVPVVSVAALVQHPLMGVMVKADAGIARPADLVGETVAYPGIASQEAFLATMLETDGAALADIELVNVSFELIPAVLSGRAAGAMGAYWTHETILAEREGTPVEVLRVEDWGVPDYYELILTANEATLDERPETVRALLRAIQRGYGDAAADPDAALDALAAAYPDLVREVEAEGLALLIPEWTDGVPTYGTQTAARWDAFGAWMKGRGLIPEDLDVAAAWDGEVLPAGAGTPVAGMISP